MDYRIHDRLMEINEMEENPVLKENLYLSPGIITTENFDFFFGNFMLRLNKKDQSIDIMTKGVNTRFGNVSKLIQDRLYSGCLVMRYS